MDAQAQSNPSEEGQTTKPIEQPPVMWNPPFAILADHVGEGVIVFDLQGRMLFSNPAAQLHFHSPEDLKGKSLQDFIASEPYQQFNHRLHLMEPGHSIEWTFEIQPEHGNSRHISLIAHLLQDPQTQERRVLGILGDHPDYPAPEDLSDGIELQYRYIVEDQTDLIFRFHVNGTISYANEAYCRYWNKTRGEVVGTSLMANIPREDRPRIRAQFTSLTPACPAVTYETRVVMSDGSIHWQQRTDRAIFDEKYRPIEYLSVGHDITERKLAETVLKHQLAMEDIVMNISTRFINVSTGEIDHEIQRAMRLLGDFLGVDYSFLVVLEPDQSSIGQFYEWHSKSGSIDHHLEAGQDLSRFKWAMRKLLRLETLQVRNMDDLPEEAQFEKSQWQEIGIRSLLALPLAQGKQLVGFIAFETGHKEMVWSEDEIGLMKVIGEIYVSVLLRKQSTQALQETQIQLSRRIKDLESRTREINLLTEMSNMLQIASQFEETYLIVADYSARLFPGVNGSLWMANASANSLHLKSQWGQAFSEPETISQDDCWSLRRGRIYHSTNENQALFCRHVTPPLPTSSVCVPILTQGKTAGLLHLQTPADLEPLDHAALQLAAVTAEQVGLALSNLQLRQDLLDQAIRDPLTSLYNRYYMEISLERELNRAARNRSPVCLLKLDIDHFREVNDQYSHAAGDLVLAELGRLIRSTVRVEDIASRNGGEEFILILPDTSPEIAAQRAQQLQEEIRRMTIWYDGQQVSTVTVSIGLASWPKNARNVDDLIRAAERALLQAKQEGRDRIIIAD